MEEGLSNLKWSYHKIKFFENLKLIRKKSNYTDATLAVDGKFYPVHKLVMSLFSEYFSDIFEQTSCKSPVIVLKDVRSHEIEALLDYMYLGEVNVNQNDLASLLKTAECLRIEGLAAVPDKNQTKIFKNSTSSHGDTARGSPPPKRRRQDSNRLPQCTPSIQKSASASATASSSSSASVLASRVHSHSIPPNSSSNNEKDEFLNFVKVEMDDLEEHDESLRRENNYDGDASNELDPSGDYWSDISITEHEDDLNVSQSGVVHQQPIIQKQQHRKQQQQPQQMPSRLPKPPTGYIQTIADMLTARQIKKRLSTIAKSVSDLQTNGIAAFFYMHRKEEFVYYGDKAIERHIKDNILEIMNQPDYNPRIEPSQSDKERILHDIEILRSTKLEPEWKMSMMNMRAFATSLMRVAVIPKHRGLYHADNKPSWFTEPIWQAMNNFTHFELRSIIASCYDYYGLDYKVYPNPERPHSPRTLAQEEM